MIHPKGGVMAAGTGDVSGDGDGEGERVCVLVQVGTPPVQGMVLPTFRASLDSFWKDPQSPFQGYVSMDTKCSQTDNGDGASHLGLDMSAVLNPGVILLKHQTQLRQFT